MAALSIAIGTTLALLATEAVLRFLPVSTGLRTQPVSAAAPLFHFESSRSSLYSSGWNFRHATPVRVNNAGFVNDVDYDANLATPLLAVIGDSYVEALMVPHALTLQGCLAQWLGTASRVYSFAASGAPLSQYLAWAEHVALTYRPDAVVFVIVGNDFDESLMRYKRGPGFHHFRERQGELSLELVPYDPSPYRDVVYASALGRYLIFNLKVSSAIPTIEGLWRRLAGSGRNVEPEHVGNTAADASGERLALSRRAVDAFLVGLKELGAWDPERIIFVVDAIRPFVYDGLDADRVRSSYFAQMRDYFMTRARRFGNTVIDLHPRFEESYKRDGVRFEFVDDAHWSHEGHRLAAQAVADLDVFRSLFESESAELRDRMDARCASREPEQARR